GVPVLLTACAETAEDGGGSGDGGGGGGTMTVGTTDKVTALDPAAAYDNGSSTVWTQCYGYLLGNLDEVEIVDDLTVEFHLKEPNDQTFPYVLTSPVGPIVDADVFPADEVLPDNEIVSAKAFSGPYTITSWKINELVTYEAFGDYKGLYGTPATSSVVMSYYADQNNMKLDIQEGNIDCVWRSLSSTDIEDLQADDSVTVHEGPGGEIRYIVFNLHTNPYGEKTEDADPDKARAVRQAVADLLDREAISKNVYAGTYLVEDGHGPDVLQDPQHEYTRKLIASLPVPDPVEQEQRRRAFIAQWGGEEAS